MGRFYLACFTNRSGRRQLARLGAALALLGTLAGLQPAQAANFTAENRVKDGYGWSGYWWPMLHTIGSHVYDRQGPFTPLLKYALFTGDYRPLEWEEEYYRKSDPQATWWGHCNGWAASSILMPEPRRALKIRLQDGGPVVEFNVGELKGLLAVAHQGSFADWGAGKNHIYGTTPETDLRAWEFHQALIDYLHEKREGVVFNITDKPEVWNFPCYAFRMTGQADANNRDLTWVTTTIWYSDDGVKPDFLGIQAKSETYTYWIRGDWRLPTAAEWTGTSVKRHPQMVWHPGPARAWDPEVDEEVNPLRVDIIKKLGQLSAGANNAVTQ